MDGGDVTLVVLDALDLDHANVALVGGGADVRAGDVALAVANGGSENSSGGDGGEEGRGELHGVVGGWMDPQAIESGYINSQSCG